MAADWGLNPEAVGAIGSAASAFLAAVAAFVAVWAGVIQPKRMQLELQRRQLQMLGPRLKGELSAIQAQLSFFQTVWLDTTADPRSGYATIATTLHCPALSESLAAGTLFPEPETRLMTKIQEDAGLLASLLLTESKLNASIPGMRQIYVVRIDQLLVAVTELLTALDALSVVKRESLIPQRPTS